MEVEGVAPCSSYEARMQRGSELLLGGAAFDAAVSEFDAAVALEPTKDPEQWKRGLALYYAGRFEEGADQFERNMAVNGSDVEEVLWRCCCDCRRLGLRAARRRLLKCGPDPRVPMPEVLELFASAGRRGIPTILALADKADDARTARAYANFYVGLFLDISGDLAAAMPYLEAAATAPSDDFMGQLFGVHRALAAASLAAAVAKATLGGGHRFSRVILGGWQLSSGHLVGAGYDQDTVLAAMAEHQRRGITSLDMGDIYTGVEALVGEHLTRMRCCEQPPGGAQIHTKLVPDLSALGRVDRAYCRAVLLRSKNRLGLLRPLDLVQFHWWDWAVGDHVAAYGCLCALREEGLVKEVGATNYDEKGLAALLDSGHPVASNQVQYSLLDRRVEAKMVPLCQKHGVALLCYGVLAGGFLADHWLGVPEPSQEKLENRSLVKYKLIVDEFGGWPLFQELLALCRGIASAHGPEAGISDVAVAYVLAQPAVGGVILGARNARHLPTTVRAAALQLTAEQLGAISGFLRARARGPSGAFFALERDRESAHGRIMRYELNLVHTQAHLSELVERVERFAAAASEDWPEADERAAFAGQLRLEAAEFPREGLDVAGRQQLDRVLEQLLPLAGAAAAAAKRCRTDN